MSIKNKIWFAFVTIFLILFASSFAGYRAINNLVESASLVAHTHEVEVLVESVISQLKDAETGQRGYLLTNELIYLEPYEASTIIIYKVLNDLKILTNDNLRQQKRINYIARLVNEKLAELKETIELNKAGNRAGAIEIVLTHSGKETMDNIRTSIDIMQSEEEQLLTLRQQASHSAIQVALSITSFGGIFVFSLIFFIAFIIVRDTNLHITERKQAEEKLEYLATHDSLTELYNRRELEQRITEEVDRATRYGHVLSACMLDIDHFKSINDTYGHQAGDNVLQDVAKVFKSTIRKTDYAVRYGGEEFFAILPETSFAKAKELAERLRSQIANHPFPIEENKELKLTVSIGIATFPEHAKSWQDLVEVADSTMYTAKKAGRNQVKTPLRATQNEKV